MLTTLHDVVSRVLKELPFFSRAEVAKHNSAEEPTLGERWEACDQRFCESVKMAPPNCPKLEICQDLPRYMIIHNKIYNLKSLMGSHPGGDDILLSRAGTDATKDFEVFEHSEKAIGFGRDLVPSCTN